MVTQIQSLIPDIQNFVRSLFSAKAYKNLVYHNLDHTLEVVHYCEELAAAHGIEGEDKDILIIAAWFHDTGYLKVSPREHEEESKRIARSYLSGKEVNEEVIQQVEQCIDATRMPQSPSNILQQILCDADLYHLGTDGFYERSMLLRDEVNNLNKDQHVSKKEWRQMNIDFLERHRYFTDHARERLETQKEANIGFLKEKLGKKDKKIQQAIEESQPAFVPVAAIAPGTEERTGGLGPGTEERTGGLGTGTEERTGGLGTGTEERTGGLGTVTGEAGTWTDGEVPGPGNGIGSGLPVTTGEALQPVDSKDEEKEKEKKKKKKDKEKEKILSPEEAELKKTERGVVAMFRIMSENHINLSQMADSKANIMISINTIVISILVSVLLGKLQFYPQYIIPTIILISVCLGAIVFSILATRPNVSEGKFSREDIQNKQINLLFFGNFYNMDLADYDWAMKEMMRDREYLYGSMIKDIYFLGVVLARKYKLLRISYNIFMFGLIAAIIAFAIALLTTNTAQ